MPSAVERDFHLDQFITNLLIGYRLPGTIGPDLLPVVNVQKQTGVFAKIDRGNWLRRPTTFRAPGTEPRQVAYTVSSDTYNARNYALGTFTTFEQLDNADPPHEPAMRAGEFLYDQLMVDAEMRIRDAIVTGVGTSVAAATAWDNFGASDPLGEVDTTIKAIRKTTGLRPNVAACGPDLWLKLRRHPDLVRAAYPGAGVGGMIDQGQFARIIGVDRLVVGEAITITSNEGQTDTFADVWSTYLVLAYVSPAPGPMTASFGYQFRWSGPNIGAGGPGNFNIFQERMDKAGRIDWFTGYYQDEKIAAPELGALITTGLT